MWTEELFWHHVVHQRLGEILRYYFVRLQPFEPKKIADKLQALLENKELGNIHSYKLFGPYDLLIRAWLHPNIMNTFSGWIDEFLPESKAKELFDVGAIDYAWYDPKGATGDNRSDLLINLTEERIRSVQTGEEGGLTLQLLDQRLLLQHGDTTRRSIKFFVTVDLREFSPYDRGREVAAEIIEYLQADADLFNEAVYRGHGKCNIIIKAQSLDFFAISKLPNWIGIRFRGARTETYLSHDPTFLIGSGRVGDSTFHEIRGRDLLAQSIVPELYDNTIKSDPRRRKEVEQFIRNEVSELEVTNNFRTFLHEFFVGYLRINRTEMLRTLYELFASLEEYLRRTYQEFVGRRCGSNTKNILSRWELGDKLKRERPPLATLFGLFGDALSQSEGPNGLLSDWNSLVKLRNDTAHANFDPTETWAHNLRLLLEQYGRLSKLLNIIGEETGDQFDGRLL